MKIYLRRSTIGLNYFFDFSKVVWGYFVIEDGELCEGGEKGSPSELVNLMVEVVFSSIEVDGELHFCNHISK